jgi:5-formyltetrahydrofolate cyclo-ligase
MSQPLDPAKRDVRTSMRAALAAMTADERHEASAAACERLMGLEAVERASVIMLYMPLASEVDLTPAAVRCFRGAKTVCVPKVDWSRRDMAAAEVSSFDDHVMDVDEHGLRSPRESRPVIPGLIDVVVVPGLAFDARCNRLGRGGGYYDRFLRRRRRGALAIGLAFDLQVIDAVPADDRDVRVNLLVTDRRVITRDSVKGRSR